MKHFGIILTVIFLSLTLASCSTTNSPESEVSEETSSTAESSTEENSKEESSSENKTASELLAETPPEIRELRSTVRAMVPREHVGNMYFTFDIEKVEENVFTLNLQFGAKEFTEEQAEKVASDIYQEILALDETFSECTIKVVTSTREDPKLPMFTFRMNEDGTALVKA